MNWFQLWNWFNYWSQFQQRNQLHFWSDSSNSNSTSLWLKANSNSNSRKNRSYNTSMLRYEGIRPSHTHSLLAIGQILIVTSGDKWSTYGSTRRKNILIEQENCHLHSKRIRIDLWESLLRYSISENGLSGPSGENRWHPHRPPASTDRQLPRFADDGQTRLWAR